VNSIDLSSAEIADREIKIIKDMEDPHTLELVDFGHITHCQ